MTKISVNSLISVSAHLGHITPKKHPKMNRFLLGEKNGINVIDLRQTVRALKEAYEFVNELAAKGGKILFVGTKYSTRDLIKKKASQTNNYYINNRWLGGTLTNFQTVKQSISKLNSIEKLAGIDLSYPGIIKKEASQLEKQRQSLLSVLAGIRNMKKMPALVFVADIIHDKISINECKLLKIPLIAITDSNTNPALIDHPIPANDDSVGSVELILDVICSAYQKGHHQYVTAAKEAANAKEKEAKEAAKEKEAKKAALKSKKEPAELKDIKKSDIQAKSELKAQVAEAIIQENKAELPSSETPKEKVAEKETSKG